MTSIDERGLQDAWNEHYASDAAPRARRPRLRGTGSRATAALLAAGAMGVIATPVAVSATGDALREGQRNGTATRETQIIGRISGTSANTGGFATRQSNLSSTGGGAIYGCRANTTTNAEPCVRANNLSTGLAFSFSARSGERAGEIRVGGGGDAKRPFTTNATGTATGLNADRVDGQEAAALQRRWVLVNEGGGIQDQSGGFNVISRPGINGQPASNPNIYIDTGQTLAGKALDGTLAIQNTTDRDGGTAGVQGDFGSGEIGVGRCGAVAQVRINCVPNGTNNPNVIVVRALENNANVGSAPRGFYVSVGG